MSGISQRMESTNKNTHILWLSFSAREKTEFLREHQKAKMESAVDAMATIPDKGGVCMVCIVNALERDPIAFENEQKMTQIINMSVGKTWNKLSKQKRHNTTNNHELPYFCTTKGAVAKALRLWRLGLSSIGGNYCTYSDVCDTTVLKKWISRNMKMREINPVGDRDEEEKKSVKRPLLSLFEKDCKKPRYDKPLTMDPISRLQAILPQLEKMVKANETPQDRAERTLGETSQRMSNYPHSKGFNVFRHPDDPVLYNAHEKRVYCKQCHHYVISHSISKKGNKFYVNDSQPCSFPLTGRGYDKYGQGMGRTEFFSAHRNENVKLQTSQWHWACGIEYTNNTYTP